MGGNYIIISCRGRFAPATTGRREGPHNHADEADIGRQSLRLFRPRGLSAAPLAVPKVLTSQPHALPIQITNA